MHLHCLAEQKSAVILHCISLNVLKLEAVAFSRAKDLACIEWDSKRATLYTLGRDGTGHQKSQLAHFKEIFKVHKDQLHSVYVQYSRHYKNVMHSQCLLPCHLLWRHAFKVAVEQLKVSIFGHLIVLFLCGVCCVC